MFAMVLGSLEERYNDIDVAMGDCLEIFPEAYFSDWNSSSGAEWLNIYTSYEDRTVIGTISVSEVV